MMGVENRAKHSLARIIFVSFWKGFAPSVPVNGEFGSKSPIYLLNAVLITMKNRQLRTSFMLLYKTNSITPLPSRLLLKLSITTPTILRKIWGLPHGKMPLMGAS